MASPTTPLSPAQTTAFLEGPALQPPHGVESNFTDPQGTLKAVAFGAGPVCIIVCTALVAVRLYTRFFVIKKHDAGDYCCALGWAMFCALAGTSSMATTYGAGAHQWDLQWKNMIQVAFWLNASSICYGFAFAFVKISILIQYRNIFVPQSRKSFMWWGTWGLSIIFALFYFPIQFIEIFLCNPREAIWNPLVPGKCMNNSAINITTGVFNTFTDWILLFMPQHVIWKLNLPPQRRLAIASVFLVGLLACIASSARLYFSVYFSEAKDVSYAAVQFGMMTYAELTFGIICACLPVMPRFMQKTFQNSLLYNRIATSLRSLVVSRGSGSRSHATASRPGAYSSQPAYRTRNPSDSEHNLKTSSSETGAEWEMDDRSYKGHADPEHGILKTVALETSASLAKNEPLGQGRKPW